MLNLKQVVLDVQPFIQLLFGIPVVLNEGIYNSWKLQGDHLWEGEPANLPISLLIQYGGHMVLS